MRTITTTRTLEQIKEQLSEHFIGLLAGRQGYKISKPNYDSGVDLLVIKVTKLVINERVRYLDTGSIIGIQLKCTTEKSITKEETGIKYDIEVKNYNDLIQRYQQSQRTKNNFIPLILIVVVLHDNKSKWLELAFAEKEPHLKINGRAYWLYPNENMSFSKNKKSIRISLSDKNQINLEFFTQLFNHFYPNE